MRIYTDFKSPTAYLAMKPTLAVIDKYALDVQWLPFKTSQFPIPAEKPNETRGESHRRVRALARRNTHLKYASIQCVPMKFPTVPGETDLALAALLYAQPSPQRFLEAAFAAYWNKGQDLNDARVITTLLGNAGHAGHDFNSEACLADLQSTQQQAEELGVVDTIAYVIEDQLFIGREHLPWIEAIISSKQG